MRSLLWLGASIAASLILAGLASRHLDSRSVVVGEVGTERDWTGAGITPRPAPVIQQARAIPTHASRSRPLRSVDRLDWEALRQCESSGNYRTDTGNGYYGAYQFDLRTWRSVGGAGNPAHASRVEQDHRARLLYADRGRQPWPECGRLL